MQNRIFWLALPLALLFSAPASAQLIQNGDFSQGLIGWTPDIAASCAGVRTVSVIPSDPPFSNVFEAKSVGAGGCGGHARILQDVNIPVAQYSTLSLTADVKAVHATVGGGCGGLGQEYPIQLTVYFTDPNNVQKFLIFAFYFGGGTCGNPSPVPNITFVTYPVPQNNWYSFNSGNLKNWIPDGSVITQIAVVGSGWDYTGRADNIALTAAQGKLVFGHGPGALVNELWVANDDGTAPRRILVMPGPVEVPRWSRDGRRIAFISGDQLWIINEDGTNQQLLNPHVSGVGLSWNAAGTGLIYGAFCTCCEYLRAIDADGTNDQLFFAGRFPIRNIDARPGDTNPQGLVAYRHTACGEEQDRSQGFYGVELTRQFGIDFSQVSGSPGVTRQFLPRWSPDGSLMATTILLGGNTADWAIEILDPDDPTAPRTRILQGPGEFWGLDFGCGADKLFFTRAPDNYQNIHRVNSDGTGLIQVTNFSGGFIRELDHFSPSAVVVPQTPGVPQPDPLSQHGPRLIELLLLIAEVTGRLFGILAPVTTPITCDLVDCGLLLGTTKIEDVRFDATIVALSPVNLVITDESGRRISKSGYEIPNSMYLETDFASSIQSPVDVVLMQEPNFRNKRYTITVSPDASAKVGDKFSLLALEMANGQLVVHTIASTVDIDPSTTYKYEFSFNQPPVANAGSDQTVEGTSLAGANVTLNGLSSTEVDGDPLTFTWTGPFGTATGATPTVTLPLGTHTITLTVDDGRGGVASDTVQITVVDTTPPAVTAPAAITVPATEAGGARGSDWAALASFLGGSSASDLVDPSPLGLSPQVGGVDVDANSLFPMGTTAVAFRFRDASGNVGSATANVTVVLGQPRISGAIAGKGRDSSERYYVDLKLTNTGTGNGRNVRLNQLTFRTLAGTGTVTYAGELSGALPLSLGNLDVGASTIVRLYLNVPTTVTRFSITETGNVQDVVGTAFSYSTGQSVIP